MSSASDYGHLVTVSVGMQNYFAQQGLWVDGAPCGKLALLLDRRVTPLAPLDARFIVTPQQLEELIREVAVPKPAGVTGQQWAQFLRRLYESKAKPIYMGPLVNPATGAVLRRSDQGPAAVPFEPLQRPAQGPAKVKFEDRLMQTLREFVDFTQSSAWIDGPRA